MNPADAEIAAAAELIESLAPAGAPVPIRTPLLPDECRWFLRAVEEGTFGPCQPDCFRFKKWGVSGPANFQTPSGRPRHLFSKPLGRRHG